MNFPLAKEVYGTPWSIDEVSFMHLNSILRNFQNGVSLDIPETKLNSISLMEISSETRLIRSKWSLDNNDSFDGIGIINLNGPITKSGGASSYGTKDLSSNMLQMSKDSRIKGFVIIADSGGGATAAIKIMQDAINEVKKTKSVYALIEKGGMAGSACYGIISACTAIYSEDEMNIVGSAGTMIQFSGKPNGTVDSEGEKHVTLYATKSTKKNKGFVEAIEKDNYKIIVNELLDPINENFLESILFNRPVLEGSNYDNGHTVFSKDAIGTFIDGIASLDEVISMILSDTSTNTGSNKNSNNNPNSKKMNKAEIKSAHPEAYAEILAEGANSEKERVNSWMAYNEADPKAVAEGIASGNAISQAQSHTFLVSLAKKGNVNSTIADLKSENAKPVTTKETETDQKTVSAEEAAEAELKAAFDFKV
ncbi:hypothetical protein [Flavobacterium phage FL-1]|nr:hypothetical protein [Flavobacterium phage FL-1]